MKLTIFKFAILLAAASCATANAQSLETYSPSAVEPCAPAAVEPCAPVCAEPEPTRAEPEPTCADCYGYGVELASVRLERLGPASTPLAELVANRSVRRERVRVRSTERGRILNRVRAEGARANVSVRVRVD